jgi:hypothetical protein
MNNDSDQPDDLWPNGSPDEAMNYFCRRLEQFNSSSNKVDELLKLLREMQEGASVDKEAEEMLSLIIDDALAGTDIASRYPIFFKKLLANDGLREAFLDSLDLLEQSRAGALEPLPAPPSQNLDFLYQNEPEVNVESQGAGRWHVSWQQTAAQLQRIFSLSDLVVDTPYNLASTFAAEDWFTLFHSPAVVESRWLEVALEGLLSRTEPALRVMATIALAPGEDGASGPPTLTRATLQWGQFEQTPAVGSTNQVVFSAVPLATIMDAAGKKVASPLLLTLELSE